VGISGGRGGGFSPPPPLSLRGGGIFGGGGGSTECIGVAVNLRIYVMLELIGLHRPVERLRGIGVRL